MNLESDDGPRMQVRQAEQAARFVRDIGADSAGILIDDRGHIQADKQQRTNVPHIFAIGDATGQPMLVHEGKVATAG